MYRSKNESEKACIVSNTKVPVNVESTFGDK